MLIVPLCYLHSPSALHFNIPLWYSSPHESLETISPTHPRLTVDRKLSQLVPNPKSPAVLSVSCQNWDYSQNAQPEVLRLNAGVLVTPETESNRPSFVSQTSVHPRPGPLSPPPSTDIDIYRVSEYTSPRKHVVSYTAVLPAGQDPRSVYVGWTTAQFCYIASQYQTSGARNGDGSDRKYGQTLECVCDRGARSGSKSGPPGVVYSHSSAYLVCVSQLLTGFTDQNLSAPLRWVIVHIHVTVYTCHDVLASFPAGPTCTSCVYLCGFKGQTCVILCAGKELGIEAICTYMYIHVHDVCMYM